MKISLKNSGQSFKRSLQWAKAHKLRTAVGVGLLAVLFFWQPASEFQYEDYEYWNTSQKFIDYPPVGCYKPRSVSKNTQFGVIKFLSTHETGRVNGEEKIYHSYGEEYFDFAFSVIQGCAESALRSDLEKYQKEALENKESIIQSINNQIAKAQADILPNKFKLRYGIALFDGPIESPFKSIIDVPKSNNGKTVLSLQKNKVFFETEKTRENEKDGENMKANYYRLALDLPIYSPDNYTFSINESLDTLADRMHHSLFSDMDRLAYLFRQISYSEGGRRLNGDSLAIIEYTFERLDETVSTKGIAVKPTDIKLKLAYVPPARKSKFCTIFHWEHEVNVYLHKSGSICNFPEYRELAEYDVDIEKN
ncbi:hypothetical protein [Lonepinella sp. BR2357]|uniref:hypothetical protein n=1 Tax=Lonepinella sp. BR2357 TaxID=3434549 RepID=UPI003F6DB7BD